MPLVQSRTVSLPSPDLIKMEERKRPAIQDPDESAPPHKKHATSINGGSKPHVDADMPWKDDLEVSRKITDYPKHLVVTMALRGATNQEIY